MSKKLPRCNPEVFKKGQSILIADTYECGAERFEEWVKLIAKRSGQPVDWHYSGGRANMLYLGDRKKVCETIDTYRCPAQILHYYGEGETGPYRAGVTPTPDNAIASYTGVNGEPLFIVDSTH
jgi:hypothetical protein